MSYRILLPDLTGFDFCLFSYLKKSMREKYLSFNDEITIKQLSFADLSKSHDRNGILKFEVRWNKCIKH